jgi:diguanylate cyclase (GGDEF)-like protein
MEPQSSDRSADAATRILIVDDSPDNLAICTKILTRDSYEILSASSGKEALSLVETEKPDVVLLDVQMPEMSGFEVCERLKADESTAHIPILFITAHNRDVDSVSRGLALGADDYILKPFNSAELRARVAVLARLKQTVDALMAKNAELEAANRALAHANAHMARAQEALAELAVTDPLTGVYNRRYLDQRAAETFSLFQRQQAPLHLLALDLDHFKTINDRYGHPVGDQVLVNFADILKRCVRRHDVVARTGGEEFAILMYGIPQDQAIRAAERIRGEVAQTTLSLAGQAVRVTTSIGLASMLPPPRPVQGPQDLLSAADAALYQAKNEGRNRVVIAA